MAPGIVTFLKLLWANKTTVISVAAVLGLCLYVMSLKQDIHEWSLKATKFEGTIKELNVQLTTEKQNHTQDAKTAQDSITILKNEIKSQNDKINNLNALLAQKNKEIKDMKEEAERMRQKHERELLAILNEARPKDCQSAIQYLIHGTGELTW